MLFSTSEICGASSTNPTGGQAPYYFELGSGVGFPPFGISLNLNGVLSGTPSIDGTRTFEECAVDQDGDYVCHTVELTVNPADDPNGYIRA